MLLLLLLYLGAYTYVCVYMYTYIIPTEVLWVFSLLDEAVGDGRTDGRRYNIPREEILHTRENGRNRHVLMDKPRLL